MPSMLDLGQERSVGVQFDFRIGATAHAILRGDRAALGQWQQVFLGRLLRRFYFYLPARKRRRRLVQNLSLLKQERAEFHHVWHGEAKLADRVRGEIEAIMSQHPGTKVGYRSFLEVVLREFYGTQPVDQRRRGINVTRL